MQKGWDGGNNSGDGCSGEETGDEETGWDIDTDSGFYGSEENSSASSPLKRQMSMLGMN